MPEKSSPTGGNQPLARPVSDEPLAKTVSVEQEEESTREEEVQSPKAAASEKQESSRTEEEQESSGGEEEEKGLLDKIKDKLAGD